MALVRVVQDHVGPYNNIEEVGTEKWRVTTLIRVEEGVVVDPCLDPSADWVVDLVQCFISLRFPLVDILPLN